jgi:hypothetical protein
MIHGTRIPEQARLWASLLGQQASVTNGSAIQGTRRPDHFNPPGHQMTLLDQLLQRRKAQEETRKNLRAQEFATGI